MRVCICVCVCAYRYVIIILRNDDIHLAHILEAIKIMYDNHIYIYILVPSYLYKASSHLPSQP